MQPHKQNRMGCMGTGSTETQSGGLSQPSNVCFDAPDSDNGWESNQTTKVPEPTKSALRWELFSEHSLHFGCRTLFLSLLIFPLGAGSSKYNKLPTDQTHNLKMSEWSCYSSSFPLGHHDLVPIFPFGQPPKERVNISSDEANTLHLISSASQRTT